MFSTFDNSVIKTASNELIFVPNFRLHTDQNTFFKYFQFLHLELS